MPHRGLWRGYMGKAASATAPKRGFCCRCGKGRRREDAVQGPVERVHGKGCCRNGTESRNLLPLWKGERIIWPGEAGTNDFCYFWGVN